jgi:hypothetical protein
VVVLGACGALHGSFSPQQIKKRGLPEKGVKPAAQRLDF